MTCTYRHEPDMEPCGHLARWIVTVNGERLALCTIHKLTVASRNPDALVELR
jgi:hypothetical protein